MSRTEDSRPTSGRFGRFLVETLLLVVVAVTVAALLRMFVVQAFVVPSGSMLPTIEQTDRIVVSKLSDPERGDVIVFEDPGGWLPPGGLQERTGLVAETLEFIGVLPASDRGYLVKRLVGLPGDRVACCDPQGRVTVNGEPLVEPYLPRGAAPSNQRFDVTVPRGRVWVLGDNRPNSGDSRPHLDDGTAFVPRRDIVGPAFAIVWPLPDVRRLDAPPTYEDVPAPERPAPRRPVVRGSPG
jgi:signal peptidase I